MQLMNDASEGSVTRGRDCNRMAGTAAGTELARVRAARRGSALRGRLLAGLGLAALLAFGTALGPVTAMAADAKPPPQTVSPEVGKKLKPAQEALQKNDYDTGMQLAKEALEIAKKPYDKEMALRMIAFALGRKQDFLGYAQTLEQLNELDTVPVEEKNKSYKTLAQIYGQKAEYEKSVKYARRWAETGGGSDAYELLATVYMLQKDCQNGVAALEQALVGREGTEAQLKQQNYCYYQLGDKPKRQAVMEQLVRRFMKREYFIDLMNLYQDANPDERLTLNLYRFGFDRDYLTRENEFVEFAELAVKVGSPSEALQALDKWQAKAGTVKPSDRVTDLLRQARRGAAEDKQQVAALDKQARAGTNGEADVAVGLVYLGVAQYDKAVEAIQRGLQPDRVKRVKRVDDANMILGIAFTKLQKKDEAGKAFTAAKADPRMARAAEIWLEST
jgi:tetratricopeptide (TPR) repeat protein